MLNRRVRMGDVGLGYQPHVIAFNTWAGLDAPQAPEGSSGLRYFTIEMPAAADLAALRARLGKVRDIGDGFEATDPAANRVRVKVAA